MKNAMRGLGLLWVGLFLISAWGCRVRTYTVEKPRVDLEVSGNQGYLAGNPPPGQRVTREDLSSTRKIKVLELDVGPKRESDTVYKGAGSRADVQSQEYSEDIIFGEPQESFDVEDYPEAEYYKEKQAQPEKFETYTVKSDDTLQKISKRFYGTTKKWIDIYQANSDVLASSDQIYPGQELKIPLNH